MAKSPEYSDLPWVKPRSYTEATRARVQLIVIHTTEGSAHAGSAEDGAAYDARRTDGTSAHYYVDSDSLVQCVRTRDIAHTAMQQGNKRGIHYELCGRAAWSADTWAGEYATAMLKRAARQAARDAWEWSIPIRRVTIGQMRMDEKGFCGHDDIRLAWGQTTHTDPGRNFPWKRFIGMVQEEYDNMYAPKPVNGDEMPTAAEVVNEFEKRMGDKESVLYKRMRAAAWQLVADDDETPRSALRMFQDVVKLAEENAESITKLENDLAVANGKLGSAYELLTQLVANSQTPSSNPPPTGQQFLTDQQ